MRNEREIRKMLEKYEQSLLAYSLNEDEYCDLISSIIELEWVLEGENS